MADGDLKSHVYSHCNAMQRADKWRIVGRVKVIRRSGLDLFACFNGKALTAREVRHRDMDCRCSIL